MTAFHQRHKILASLEAMDQAQTEKVLSYINTLLAHPAKDNSKNQIKSEALRQIRQALKENQA